MLHRFQLLTAAVLATSVGLAAAQQNVQNPAGAGRVAAPTGGTAAANTAVDAKLPAGINVKNLNEDRSIDRTFKNTAESALSARGFNDLIDNLVDQDRDRLSKSLAQGRSLGNVDGADNKRLKDLVAGFSGSFKTKYGKAFDVDISKVYTQDFVRFQTGEIADPLQLVGKWPVPNVIKAGTVTPTAGTITQADANEAANKMFGGDVNLEKGRNVALAVIPASHGLPAVNVSLIHESVGGWKIDMPNNVSTENLYNNLIMNLSYLDKNKTMWPADINDAHRQVTHAVLAAIYNVSIDPSNVTALDRN